MSHLQEGMILALRDGMLVDADVRAHLDACSACGAALADAAARARMIQAALADAATPVDVGAAREAVRTRLSGAHPRPARAPSPSRHLGRAAAMLLLAAGAAFAVPGSPVRDWIEELVPRSAPTSAGIGQVPQTAPPESGIAVNVPDGEIQVVIRGAAPGSLLDVVWVDAATAAVRAGGASTFTYRDGYVEVRAATGDLRVELPRWARMASVEVDGRIYVRRSSGDVEVPGPSIEAAGDRIRFLIPGP